MIEQDKPLPLSGSHDKVLFYDGLVWTTFVQFKGRRIISLKSVRIKLYVLLSGDSKVQSDDAESDVSSEESNQRLNTKRKEESENLQETLYNILSRHQIFNELLRLFENK